MKRKYLTIVTIAMIVIAALTISSGSLLKNESRNISESIQGTWKLVSTNYGSNPSGFTDLPAIIVRMKLITDTHFTWVGFSTIDKKVSSSAGGKYTLDGNTYTESIDFGLNMDTYIGQKHAFTVKVEGDRLFMSGSLSDGLSIAEIWERVK
jgi:hypothetical protein